jgi:hypothetical protein
MKEQKLNKQLRNSGIADTCRRQTVRARNLCAVVGKIKEYIEKEDCTEHV